MNDLRFTSRPRLVPLLVVAFMAMPGARVRACAVPVFQYAMQNWPPDDYTLVIVHRGPLAQKYHDLLESWERSSEFLDANLQIRLVDLETDDYDSTLLIPDIDDAPLPYAILQYPENHEGLRTVWQGPLEHPGLRSLCTSPLRTRIAGHLLGGDTATWVLLESGDRAADDRAAALLAEQLARLEETLVPGEQPENPVGDVPQTELKSDDIPVRFSILRLARDDQDEQIFVRMLLRSEADLEELDAPMAFPVFGRGRALYALVGDGIAPEVIARACAFLVGGCSCVVKLQNPGTDLLMSCEWEDPGEQAAFVARPESEASSNPESDLSPAVPMETDATVTEAGPPLWRNAMIGAGLGVALVALVGYVFMRRGQQT